MAVEEPGKATDTLNWDTVFAIPVTKVNEAIVKKKTSPPNFTYHSPKYNTVQGNFGDWQIARGGDGALVWLTIPVQQVTGKTKYGDFTWNQGELIVEVRLKFIPHTEAAVTAAADPNIKPLALKIRTASDNPDDPVISLKNTLFTQPITGDAVDNIGDDVMQSLVPTLIIAWLNEHLAAFEHVFATVNLNAYIDKNATWAWTKPTYTDYAYTDGANLDASLLGVLCMTGGRTGTVQQIQTLDPYAIPRGSIAGFLVSPERMLNDLMLPTLPMKWKHSTVADYEVVTSSDSSTGRYTHVLKLKDNVSVQLDPVEHDGSSYTPYLKKMSISIEETEVVFETYTETDVGMGVTAWCSSQHWYSIELGNNANGQTLVYKESKQPVIEQGTHTSTETDIERWMIIIAGVIAIAVVGIVTEGAGLAVGGIVIGLLTGLAASSPDIIAAVNSDTSPSLDLLTFNTTDPIKWDDSGVFQLSYAGLNGPLQLGGTPRFAP